MASPMTGLFTKFDEFLLAAGKSWKLIKEVKEKVEPMSKTSEAFELAEHASTGELSAYTGGIEKLRVYVAKQKDRLADLARNDENYWADRSGADALKPAAMLKARSAVDQWITNFTQLKILIQQVLPAVQSAQALLSNTKVVAARSALEESSLPALDGIALGQIVGDLNNSIRSLDLIIQRLRNCRRGL